LSEVCGYIKISSVPAGMASPALPTIGKEFIKKGLNAIKFCKDFNKVTKKMSPGEPLTVVVTHFNDKSFNFTYPMDKIMKNNCSMETNNIGEDEMNISARDKNGDKFRELAEKRVTKVIMAIRNLKRLSNKNNYSYQDQEVKKMISAIRAELSDLDSSFKSSSKNSSKVFSFKK